MIQITDEERDHLKTGPEAIEKLLRERRALIYALLVLYHGGKREGWEEGMTLNESIDNAFNLLCNIGFDPHTSDADAYIRWYPSEGKK